MLRRRLILGVLVTAPRDWKKLARRRRADRGRRSDMSVEVDRGSATTGRGARAARTSPSSAPRSRRPRWRAVAGRIADCGANIDRIERMARYPVTAIDLHVSGADPERLRTLLAAEAATQGIDIAVQPANLLRRGMRLIVMDVDSTLIQGEVIEMLAAHAGAEPEVAARHRAGDARRARLRGSRCAPGSRCSRARRGRARRGVRRHRARPRRPDHGAHPAPAGLPVRDRLRRLHPDHRPARRGPRHPLLPRQRARDRRRPAHRPDRRRRGRPGRQGRRRCASSRPRSASPRPP